MEPSDKIFKNIINKCRLKLEEYEPNFEKTLIYAGPFSQAELVKLRKSCNANKWNLTSFGQNTTDVFLLDTQFGLVDEVFGQYLIHCNFYISTKTFTLGFNLSADQAYIKLNSSVSLNEITLKWNEYGLKYKKDVVNLFDNSELSTFYSKIKLAIQNNKEWINELKHVSIQN